MLSDRSKHPKMPSTAYSNHTEHSLDIISANANILILSEMRSAKKCISPESGKSKYDIYTNTHLYLTYHSIYRPHILKSISTISRKYKAVIGQFAEKCFYLLTIFL